MKILSYNINRSTQEKIDKIMQFNADVFILPEVACPSQVKVPEGYRMEWMGNYDFKGLGVIWKSGMKAEIPQWYFPTVISGDMNCYKGQAGETKQYSIETIFSFLEGMGYVSAYHQKTGELLGKESKATYYHWFNENSPFFLDYTFSNIAIKSYALCEWDKEVSDHVAQYFEL